MERREPDGPSWPARLAAFLPVLLLAAALVAAPGVRSTVAPPAPSTAPVIDACWYVPNVGTNAHVACGDPGYASANVSIFFQVNVSDASVHDMTVTYSFDYYGPLGALNSESPVRTVTVPYPGDASPVGTTMTWAYKSPNANFSDGKYFVSINVTNGAGEVGTSFLFPIFVSYNSPPYMNGLLSLNSVAQSIQPHNPAIPLVYENVTVGDPDGDALNVSWDWGDGTWTLEVASPPFPKALSVAHQYPASSFPLNETPRYVDLLLRVWIDDSQGHNVSEESVSEFYLDFDAPPSVRIDRPTVGSWWKVGETVTMAGTVTDPEGDPTTAYWDFDNRSDSTGTGNPERNVDASGTTASHAYTAPGTYNISLWATDGDKLLCQDPVTCANFTTHWRRAIVPIQVQTNRPPVVGLSNATATTGEPVLLSASVYDPDGDNMTVRWVFGDGTPDAFNYTGNSSRAAPAVYTVYREHTYAAAGVLAYTVSASDGSATVSQTKDVFVQSFNLPPVILAVALSHENGTVSANNTFLLHERLTVRVSVYDPENDTLNVSVDWADGNSSAGSIDPTSWADCSLDNLTRNICSISFSHAYDDIGRAQFRNFTLVLTVTDGQAYLRQNASGGPPIILNHTKEWNVAVFITNYQAQGLGPWDWWDYSTLAAVVGLPTFLIVRFAWKVRREREEA